MVMFMRADLHVWPSNLHSHEHVMLGAEGFAVAGVISSIISIVDATKKIYNATTKAHGLPEAFRQIAGQFPIVEDKLNSAEQYIKGKISIMIRARK